MALEDVLEGFNEYIFNEIPTHLLRISDRMIMSREEIKQTFQPQMESITEADIEKETVRTEREASMRNYQSKTERQDVIRNAIRRRLRFAIFSHRWLATGEPSFQEVARRKEGMDLASPEYEKLWMLCQKAREYKCEYVWADTCCIDKTSSAELEEAIRSMFRWYRNAEVCIAYLGQTSSTADLHSEAWFRRGWTLQELLASRKIRFFGKAWVELSPDSRDGNDKAEEEMLRHLREVTGIPRDDLAAFTPGVTRVYEKMIWASKRKTTRVEDVAYSLLGIFDISMSVSYGERHWAFHRLMEIIVQRCREPGILAWAGKPSPYAASLPASPQSYLGLDAATAIQLHLVPDIGNKITGIRRSMRGDTTSTMTKRGLQIKLAIVDVEMISPYKCDSGRTLPGMHNQPLSSFVDDIDVIFRPKGKKGILGGVAATTCLFSWRPFRHWALGIVDYYRTSRNNKGCLYAGDEYLCLALGQCNRADSHVRTDFEGWQKIETQNILTISCKKNLRTAVQTVWLWRDDKLLSLDK
ncbi:heterokaryon incompatibility protein-domain-containing protein [Phlebopus sp. FC_14]|nr:heterokaryon incompatibility protein-domain-containing protein [Phlebopus sp. FC_14]